MQKWGITASLFMALFSSALVHASPEITAEGNHFKDSNGRTIILRGVNVSGHSKVPPFIPLLSAKSPNAPDVSLLEPLPSWGINVIRLLFIWEAFEPNRGQFNHEYLDHLVQVVRAAQKLGIYVIVDFHQDVYSRFTGIGCGSGFPMWSVDPGRLAVPATDLISQCDESWAPKSFIRPSVHSSFGDFYKNKDGIRDEFLQTWWRIIYKFKPYSNVIGYDLLNEPVGDEKTEIAPLQREQAQLIRSIDPTATLFLSPNVLTSFGIIQSDLPKPDFQNVVYSPHFYDVNSLTQHAWDPANGKHDIDNELGTYLQKSTELGIPLFFGELGTPPSTKNSNLMMNYVYDWFDLQGLSGTQWGYTPEWNDADKDGWNHEDFSIVDDHGHLRSNFPIRPYAQKVSGEILQNQVLYDDANQVSGLKFVWNHHPEQGPTEIYFPKALLSPDRSTHTMIHVHEKDLHCSWDRSNTKLYCRSKVTGEKHIEIGQNLEE